MSEPELQSVLVARGYELRPPSVREIGGGTTLFVVRRDGCKLVGLLRGPEPVTAVKPVAELSLGNHSTVSLYELTWEAYQQLARLLPLSPSPCNKSASFGTGDRLGMVTAAHLEVERGYNVFPVIAQQSPRELERTGRSFKSVLLDAVMGVLESGYAGAWGADADHIKDEARFAEGVEAGYSMYTLDVSEDLQSIDGLGSAGIAERVMSLDDASKGVIEGWFGKKIGSHAFDSDEMTKSAIIYEKAMRRVIRFDGIAKSRLSACDLEVSIDEGARETTPEDHLFVAEYLHRAGVDFRSLAPKFPGEFQKAIDYKGDLATVEQSFQIHAEIARRLQGYKLSLHSGSDKFSVYTVFSRATEGAFHIKTSGTSWLQAINVIAHKNTGLFEELYSICLAALPESKKAYHVYITPEQFPARPTEDLPKFFSLPGVQQLFHISYGVLLSARGNEIIGVLQSNETQHYELVKEHLQRHLKLLLGVQ